jgi:hypothetical protein
MTEKTTTILVIESHEQTIIRRSRRTMSEQVVAGDAGARPRLPQPGSLGGVRRCFGVLWRRVALKGATVFAPWSQRLKEGTNDRGTK